MVARNRVPVVLIDTMDKATAGPLLRSPSTPKGYLSLNQIAAIDCFARAQGVRLLWAGGITLPKVYDLGRLGVFGIYVTSAVASPAPVPPGYERDPWLANVKEPTFEGVLHAKLLLEAGFLSVRLQNYHIMEILKTAASNFLLALEAKNILELKKHQKILADYLGEAWRQFRAERGPLSQRKILGYKS